LERGIEGGADDQISWQATSVVAPNESGPTADLPRRNERPEELMAFGSFKRAGAAAGRVSPSDNW